MSGKLPNLLLLAQTARDLVRLETRLLVQGNSGSGKSHLLKGIEAALRSTKGEGSGLGLSICRRLRAANDVTPIIMLTAKGEEVEDGWHQTTPGPTLLSKAEDGAVFLLNSTDVVTDNAGLLCGKVWDDELRRTLAMKVVLGKGESTSGGTPDVDPKTLGRFLEEAQVTSQLDHPGVVPVHELGLDQSGKVFELKRGPIFANVVLADEINRATPKTQSALLEAMEERQVTVDGRTYAMERPFLVLATQNPIEYEGTFPLPEAQIDRFMLKVVVGYPTKADEKKKDKDKK